MAAACVYTVEQIQVVTEQTHQQWGLQVLITIKWQVTVKLEEPDQLLATEVVAVAEPADKLEIKLYILAADNLHIVGF